jgi:FkbM family methyltransferase
MMINQKLKNNKIIQRIKAVKDLILEKLDNINLKSDQKIAQGSFIIEKHTKILEEGIKTQQNTNILIETVGEIKSTGQQLIENGVFLLKSSVDTVKAIQFLLNVLQQMEKRTENTLSEIRTEFQHGSEKSENTLSEIRAEFQHGSEKSENTLSEIRAEFQHGSEKSENTLSEIRAEFQQYYQYTMQKLIEFQEDSRNQDIFFRETLENIYSDIHNQKFKVVTDLLSFKDIEAELMSYLYSYLPHHRAIDIGANRGEVSSRLLQAGYEVYAFEPFPPVVEKLKEHLGNNPNLHIFPFAIGKVNEERELHIVSDEKLLANPEGQKLYPDSDYTLLSSLSKHSLPEGLIFTDSISISVKTLESLHNTSKIPSDIGLVKIDTEGSDLEVILGMGEHRYPVVVAEFWDSKFPFGQFGANNKLEDLVEEMKRREYDWFIVIYKIFLSNDVSYYCNNKFSIENSWGNVFFFQDYQVFSQALKWCSAVMPATYFSNNI